MLSFGATRITDVAVERGLFTAAPDATDLVSRHGLYPARRAAGPGLDQLSLALQQRLADAEVQLAMLFRKDNPDASDLLFVDGPLRGRTHLPRGLWWLLWLAGTVTALLLGGKLLVLG